MRGGVAIIVVPLLAIGAGQAAAAKVAMSEDLDAFHWDDMNSAARRDLLGKARNIEL